jgi:hypothetical protein
MTRRPSKHLRPARPLSSSHGHAELKADGRWLVATMAGARAVKTYQCPGCQSPIPPGMAHLVVWPEESPWPGERAVDQRRHWHSACWGRRR